MGEIQQSLQILPPLGRASIPENCGHDALSERRKNWSRWLMTLVALLLCITTAAAAVMAASRSHGPIPELWKQSPPSLYTKGPEGGGFRELLF